MLPFLKRSQDASSSTPVETITREPDEGAEYDSLESAAEDLLAAINSKSVPAIAAALRAAFDICDSSDAETQEEP